MSESTLSSPEQAQSSTGADRRSLPRHACALAASCRPLAAARADRWPAQVRDVSRGGIGLILGRRFEAGTQLALEVECHGQEGAGTLMARVVRVTPQSGGRWLLGCVFLRQLGQGPLTALLAGQDAAEGEDTRRAWVHLPGEQPNTSPAAAVAPRIVAFSAEGMSLILPARPKRGLRVPVRLPGWGRRKPVHVRVRITQTRSWPEGGWLVSCEFSAPLEESLLRALSV